MFGAGPMFDVGPISFNSPILISLEEKGVAEEITACPRVDVAKGNFLLQTWHEILFASEICWKSDNRLFLRGKKVGLSVLTSEFLFFSIGLIGQMPVNKNFLIETFFGGKPGETISTWLKIKAFF